MTRLAYLLQTHRDPAQVRRLVTTISRLDPDGLIHVSHDAASSPIDDALAGLDAVLFRDPGGRGSPLNYARWLRAAQWVLAHEDVDYLVTVTGQDYPVKTADFMKAALVESGGGAMEYFDVMGEDSPWPLREARSRYWYSWQRLCRLGPQTKRLLRPLHAVNRVQPLVRVNVAYDNLRVAVRSRGLPDGVRCYGGSAFVNVSAGAAQYLLDTVRERADVQRWLRRSLAIDEAGHQSLLLSSDRFRFENDPRRFFDFKDSELGSPRFLGVQDVDAALTSTAFFARKWRWSDGTEALNRIDDRLGIGSVA